MQCEIFDIDLYYEEHGTGRPLLVLHGRPLDHRHVANDFEPAFTARKGWRRIYPDLPGFGRTKASSAITCEDDMLEVIFKFMDAVAPGERLAVAGTSYGGFLARGLVHHRAEQLLGVMLNVPGRWTEAETTKLPEHRVTRTDADFLAALGPKEQDIPDTITIQSLEVLQDLRDFITPAVAMADQEFLGRIKPYTFDANQLPAPFPAPTLILTGRFDHWCGYDPAYQLLDLFPRATFVVLDAASHALAMEQKALFRVLVSDWLDRVEEYIQNIQ